MATINYRLSNKIDKASGKSMILVDVSTSRTFRVRGNTKLYVLPKDWDEKNHDIRKTSRIENRIHKMELEELRSKLNRLREHITKNVLQAENLNTMVSKEERQNWITFIIESFFDPSVKLLKDKHLSFQEFTDIYVQVRSEEEGWKRADSTVINQKAEWDNVSFHKLRAVKTQIAAMNPMLQMDDIS